MILATIVTPENAPAFLPAVSTQALRESSLFIGAYDEETDTACGVLAAELVTDDSLEIRFLYVEEGWRRMGAGNAMVSLLRDIAADAGIRSIRFAFTQTPETDALVNLLQSCGFAQDASEDASLYAMRIGDLDAQEVPVSGSILALADLTQTQWGMLGALLGDSAEAILSDGALDETLSFAAFDDGGTLTGTVLVLRREDGADAELVTLPDAPSGAALLHCAARAAQQALPPDARLYSSAGSREEYVLLHALCSGRMTPQESICLMSCEAV